MKQWSSNSLKPWITNVAKTIDPLELNTLIHVPMVVFFGFQTYFARGLLSSSVKG